MLAAQYQLFAGDVGQHLVTLVQSHADNPFCADAAEHRLNPSRLFGERIIEGVVPDLYGEYLTVDPVFAQGGIEIFNVVVVRACLGMASADVVRNGCPRVKDHFAV